MPVTHDDMMARLPKERQARIKARYTDDVPLLPGGYRYQWLHELDVDMRRMAY